MSFELPQKNILRINIKLSDHAIFCLAFSFIPDRAIADVLSTRHKGVDGLTGFFTNDVRLSHHFAQKPRTAQLVRHTTIALYQSP
jgi:hypothetical protein